MRFLTIALSVLCLLVVTACSGAPAPDISIQNAHIQAPLGGRDVTLGGFEITAIGADIKLLGATSTAATKIELHTMTETDGVMKMRRLEDGINVPAGDTVTLGRGGAHLMVFGFDDTLQAGDSVTLELAYEQGGQAQSPISLTAIIQDIGEDHSAHGS